MRRNCFLWCCGEKCILQFLHRICRNEILQSTHDIGHYSRAGLGITRSFLHIFPNVCKVFIKAADGLVNNTVSITGISSDQLVRDLHDLITATKEVETSEKEGGVSEEACSGDGGGVGPEVRAAI